MRLAAVVLMFAFASAGCDSKTGAQSCQEYYELNEGGNTQAERDFCLTQGSKSAGNCCVGNNQCISNVCCGWKQSCAPSASCECVGP